MIKIRTIMLSMMLITLSLRVFSIGLSLESSAFQNNKMIPKEYTCKGTNISPPLSWKDAPAGTVSYVLIVDDPDAPKGNWVHWLLFNIPAAMNHLDKDTKLPRGAISGKNSWEKPGFSGPCPPQGTHRYIFTLYALDTRLTVNSSVHKEDILNAMQKHVLGTSQVIGLYGK